MSKMEAFEPEKYSKNDGGLFKITLFADSRRDRKNDPGTPHFREVFGAKIVPRSKKSRFEIVLKIHSIFNQFFYRFWLHFGPSGRP